MTTARIKKTKKGTIVKTGERFIDVEIEVTEGSGDNKVTETVRWGYPLTVTEARIKKDIKNHLKNRKAEAEAAVAEGIVQASEAKADKTIKALSGLEVKGNV